ncbi:hypothetical protein FRB91_004073 [Serendipita sp. 411]|nr:hypothetical protein FRB91_004073 [Serendipita sp. 411]
MPGHYRTRSCQRSASVPPSSPPLVFHSSHSAREKARRTPIVPSARRLRLLETRTESIQSPHLQAALALCGPRRTSAPSVLGPAIVLQTSPSEQTSGRHQEQDDDVFIIHQGHTAQSDPLYAALEARAFDWRDDPFGESPQYVYGQRPKHKHRRSSSKNMNLRPSPYGKHQLKLQPTLLSATPSPAVSVSNSPAPSPMTRSLTLNFDFDVDMLMPPTGWPTSSGAGTGVMAMSTDDHSDFMPTPAFSTPALSPSASSVAASPYTSVDGSGGPSAYGERDYFSIYRPRVPHTPIDRRPVPQ